MKKKKRSEAANDSIAIDVDRRRLMWEKCMFSVSVHRIAALIFVPQRLRPYALGDWAK